jgi:hypothetical protein
VVRKEIVSKVKRLYKKYEPAELAAKRNDSINKCLQILNGRKKIKDKQMVNEKIAKRLGRFVKRGQISCRQCFKIAGESKVNLKSIGDACNKMKIKIRSCQLGCFK